MDLPPVPASSATQAGPDQTTVIPVVVDVANPCPGCGIGSRFGPRGGEFHAGVDLPGDLGAPIYAAVGGLVLRTGPATGFGNAVYILAADGSVQVYGHMNDGHTYVTPGDLVNAGDHIADVGNAGDVQPGPGGDGSHLHFEVHEGDDGSATWFYQKGTAVDPVAWLNVRGVQVG